MAHACRTLLLLALASEAHAGTLRLEPQAGNPTNVSGVIQFGDALTFTGDSDAQTLSCSGTMHATEFACDGGGNAGLCAENAALRAQMAALEQRLTRLEAAQAAPQTPGPPSSPPSPPPPSPPPSTPPPSPPLERPDRPSIQSVSFSNGATVVSFDAAPGAAPVSYTLTWQDESSLSTAAAANGSMHVAAPASNVTVAGLTAGHRYAFELTARNSRGASAPSAPFVSSLLAGGEMPPGRVLNLTGTSVDGSGAMHLAWQPPLDDGGAPLMHYKVARRLATPPRLLTFSPPRLLMPCHLRAAPHA